MDVVFHDDLMPQNTKQTGNMVAIRHASLNIIKKINDKASIKVRRKTLGWNDSYLFNAVTQASA